MSKKNKKIRYEELIITSDMDDIDIENVIRQRVQWRQDKLQQLLGNLPAFVIVNAIIWGGFLSARGNSFPWPIFVTFFWGMSIVKDAWELFQASTGMQSRREEYVRQEVEREKARLGIYEKPKRDYIEKSKNRPLQIGSDGEIVPLDQLLSEDDQDVPRYQNNNRRQ